MVPRSKLAAAGCVAALVAGIAVFAASRPAEDENRPEVALFTTLPIFWGESESIADALNSGDDPHWVRSALEKHYRPVPLDALEAGELASITRLILAQPRALSPAENVALDNWVRGGGRLLLFADPMLTEPSRFALGDPRRPQDVALLSPILRRWGLELQFDEDQAEAERSVAYGGADIPVRLAGSFRLVPPSAGGACELAAESMVAQCRIGKGRVTALADAALLERNRSDASRALAKLSDAALSR